MAKSTSDFSNEAEFTAYVQAHPDEPLTCSCGGNGCSTCDGDGTIPAWTQDPEISGYPHERHNTTIPGPMGIVGLLATAVVAAVFFNALITAAVHG